MVWCAGLVIRDAVLPAHLQLTLGMHIATKVNTTYLQQRTNAVGQCAGKRMLKALLTGFTVLSDLYVTVHCVCICTHALLQLEVQIRCEN